MSSVLSQEGYHALAVLARELLPTGLRPDSGVTLRLLASDASETARERYATLLATREAWGMLAAMYVHRHIAGAPCPHAGEGIEEGEEDSEQDTAPLVVLLACAYHLQERCFQLEQERQERRRMHRGEQGEEGAPC